MKIGKAPRRFGGPSQAFKDRKAEEARQAARELRLSARTIPVEGPLSVFMDDERTAPPGWVLVLDGEALQTLLDAEGGRVAQLSLDWDLGPGVPKGDTVAEALAERFARDPAALPVLEVVHFHSHNRDRAIDMSRTLRKALPADRRYDIHLSVGKPV